MRSVAVIEVIEVVVLRGDGKERRAREVRQWWSVDGVFLAEADPCAGEDGS